MNNLYSLVELILLERERGIFAAFIFSFFFLFGLFESLIFIFLSHCFVFMFGSLNYILEEIIILSIFFFYIDIDVFVFAVIYSRLKRIN